MEGIVQQQHEEKRVMLQEECKDKRKGKWTEGAKPGGLFELGRTVTLGTSLKTGNLPSPPALADFTTPSRQHGPQHTTDPRSSLNGDSDCYALR
jgi:hypothetical protein